MAKKPEERPITPATNWSDKLMQRYPPGYTGHVPGQVEEGIGCSASESSYKIAGKYPNRVGAPADVTLPDVWTETVASHDFGGHTTREVLDVNMFSAAAGAKAPRSTGVPAGGPDTALDSSAETLHSMHPESSAHLAT
eukprot:gene9645-32227_t